MSSPFDTNLFQCSYQDLETASFDVKSICQVFEEQVERIPDHPAIEYKGRILSYKELNDLTNQLARHIRKQYQIVTKHELQADTLIPISLERSAEYVIGILGILKSGGAYVPINPDYPENRIRHILSDINGTIIITESRIAEQFKKYSDQLTPICFDQHLFLAEAKENLYVPISPNDLAYVIYTSGSSGTPKGVMAEHKNVLSQVLCASYFSANETDTVSFCSDVSFDSTTFEIWGALLNGAKLFIPDNFYELISDAQLFKKTVIEKNLTIVLLTRSLFDLLYTQDPSVYCNVRTMLVGAEALTKNIMQQLVQSEYKPKLLINAYGPTENSTFCVTNWLENDFSEFNSVPIGKPYSNRIGLVLDKHFQLMPVGVAGELFVGGPSLSRGYLNQPELSHDKFIPNHLFIESGKNYPRIYKTNDVVKWLPHGKLEYVARNDFQVKLRGYRIELGEIETRLLEFPEIKHSVVIMEKNNSLAYLVGYYLADKKLDEEAIRKHLSSVLPDYMVPSVLVHLMHFPVTSNGKLDRRALPKPTFDEKPTKKKGTESIEHIIHDIWSKTLNVEDFGREQSFFNLGGNSLAAMMVRTDLEETFAIKINIVELFQHTTLVQLSSRITELLKDSGVSLEDLNKNSVEQANTFFNEPIAVVGMACRLPEIKNVNEYWQLLCEENTNLRDFSLEEVDASITSNPTYVSRGNHFEDVYSFDAGFFGYSIKDAESMDPQQRQFLECAWEAIEDSGTVPEHFSGDIGVFASAGRNYYFMDRVFPAATSDIHLFQSILGNEKDFLSTRVSYKLNLTGPSITLQTACSSSLVSVQMACDSLRTQGCDMALAGGVSLFYNKGYLYQDELIESPDGYCRAFDAKARGTVVSSGMGIVVLKRLSDAIAQNDTIYALIKGGALNNDGSNKMAFTAPSVKGQAAVIEKALKNAQVSPETISYIEAHGTGTMLGDPIEWAALHQVYEKYSSQQEFCTIGAVKTNIGHTDSAAGVMGLMKTVLALKNKTLPATLNFEELNPEINSFNQLFRVSNRTSVWNNQGKKRRAAVSSFGLGGTNAHLILEEYEEQNLEKNLNSFYLIPVSAKNQNSLQSLVAEYEQFLQDVNHSDLPDVAFTAQLGRAAFSERGYFIASLTEKAVYVSLNDSDLIDIPHMFYLWGELIIHLAIEKMEHLKLMELFLLHMHGQLWLHHLPTDWQQLSQFDNSVRKVRIPTYRFNKKHYEIAKVNSVEVVSKLIPVETEQNNNSEQELKNLWCKVLGISKDELNETSDFLDLGGDSLSFIDLFHFIKKHMTDKIILDELIQYNELGSMHQYSRISESCYQFSLS